MATDQVLRMNGGLGENSYANNSLLQRKVIIKGKPVLEECITRVYCNILPDCLKVADLGCSSGSNTFVIASEIIGIIHAVSCSLGHQPPEFQIFLNDLPGNDFNTVFKSLPDFYRKLQEERGEKFGPCFIVGMPGSFYGRLFPSNSMHFFHSSYSLHWLSQVPKGLTSGADAPLNKGNIYITDTSPPAVLQAYLEQFQEDFKLFLRYRSQELVLGGSMVLTLMGRLDENEELLTPMGLIGTVLNDMVLENKVEEAKVDSLDIPYYHATAEEVRGIIEAEGCFTVERLEVCKLGWDADIDEDGNNNVVDNNMKGRFIANYMRAVTEPLLKLQFGDAIMDELFLRYTDKVVQLMKVKKLEHTNLIMSLTRHA